MWNSGLTEPNIGIEMEKTVEITNDVKNKITENGNNCYILLTSHAHANERGTIDIEIYEVYLTK